MNGSDGIFDWNFRAITPHENAAAWQCRLLTECDFQARRTRNTFAARHVEEPEHFRYRPARGLLPRPAGHPVGGEIEARDVARNVRAYHGVADAIERHRRTLFLDE